MSQVRVAIVDDERRMGQILSMVLGKAGFETQVYVDPLSFVGALHSERFDVVLTDLQMPRMTGVEVLGAVHKAHPGTPVILITAHGSIASAVEAMRAGAYDYVEKPFDNDACVALVERASRHAKLTRENRYLRAEVRTKFPLQDMILESSAIQEVFSLARRAARSRATVLITGESGTGKEVLARSIHYHSERVGGPFVAVNCKALSSGVLESELFGHVKGAFTGATSGRRGYFEQADGGTLFLDEIGEIDEAFQAKLLRVLQEREITPVGSTSSRAVDVRIVAATNRDLEEQTRTGAFRQDLFFRLSVIPIHIPALRERPEDLMPLAHHFLRRWSQEMERTLEGWSPQVEEHLLTHRWPGNVRELENTIERAVVLAQGDRIELEDLLVAQGSRTMGRGETLQEILEDTTRLAIRRALVQTQGRKGEAATRLGVDRTTLYRLMKKHALE